MCVAPFNYRLSNIPLRERDVPGTWSGVRGGIGLPAFSYNKMFSPTQAEPLAKRPKEFLVGNYNYRVLDPQSIPFCQVWDLVVLHNYQRTFLRSLFKKYGCDNKLLSLGKEEEELEARARKLDSDLKLLLEDKKVKYPDNFEKNWEAHLKFHRNLKIVENQKKSNEGLIS